MYNKIVYYLDEIDRIKKGEIVYPVSVEIDPSNRCQCNCSFCLYKEYRKDYNCDLDYIEYSKILPVLRKHGVKSITFTGGGEPLMHPNFNDMLELAIINGFEVGLITNGVFLHNIHDRLIPGLSFIRISLDSASHEVYYNVKGASKFNLVIHNIKEMCKKIHDLKCNTTLGISFVVCDKNRQDIDNVRKVIGDYVSYIQFKPEISNIKEAIDIDPSKKIIVMDRFNPDSNLPCNIAGLIGIIGADGNWYYCCQGRGIDSFVCGSIYNDSFEQIMENRMNMIVDISKCQPCRYMNYAKAYEDIISNNISFLTHKNFL